MTWDTVRLVVEAIGWVTILVLAASLISAFATARVDVYRGDEIYLADHRAKRRPKPRVDRGRAS